MSAEDEETLDEASGAIHDAYFEPRAIRHDEERATLVVPFQQEGWQSGPIADQVLVDESWRAREYRVAFFRGELTVRHVQAAADPYDLGEMGMLLGLGFKRSTREVEIHAVDTLRVKVERLHVEVCISDDVAGHVRRRVGKYTCISTDSQRGFRTDPPGAQFPLAATTPARP